MEHLLSSSITCRVAIGLQQARDVFTLLALPACETLFRDGVGKVAGFSLNAGVAALADRRQKPERLRRYIITASRCGAAPVAGAERQRPLPAQDALPRWHDARLFDPLDFIVGLAGLVPKPRLN